MPDRFLYYKSSTFLLLKRKRGGRRGEREMNGKEIKRKKLPQANLSKTAYYILAHALSINLKI